MAHQSSDNTIVYILQNSHTMYQFWLPILTWVSAASEIVNEQALEALAQPSMISDQSLQLWDDYEWIIPASTVLEEQALEDEA
ncbi:hypothetical protein HD554DRAFT_2174807 [Boletus coccyginus]|nr:hypothetical protein HD554DRAFT_2174807 [Boletus coccyginus]